MPIFELQTPDGQTYEVDAPDMASALRALGGNSAPNPSLGMDADISGSLPDAPVGPPKGNPALWGTGNQAVDTLTMGGSTKLNAAGAGLLDATAGALQGEGFNFWDNYNKNLEQQRSNQAAYADQNPVRSGLGTAGGIALGVARGPTWGKGIKGAMATGAGYGALGGALEDAGSIEDRTLNVGKGILAGGTIGAGGYYGGKALGWGAEKVGRAFGTLNAAPLTKAEMEVYELIQKAGGPAAVQAKLAKLGPDAALADVLGSPGTAVGRRVANISPEARQILKDFVETRKANQNTRLATDVERASGLPIGNTKNVDALKADTYKAVKPTIDRAYQSARKAGADVDLKEFDNIITTPVGRPAFQQALDNVTTRAARNPEAGGNLAVLDETKRILDGWAKKGFRDADPMASEYASAAEALRTKLDDLLSGDEYAVARALRQDAYKADEAFDLGAELAGSRIGLGVPQSVAKVPPQHVGKVAQGYGATTVENLLNKNATKGAYASMTTPQARTASQAALGQNDSIVQKALGRERQFNITNDEIVGNSSSARQFAEMAGWGGGAAGASILMGNDIWTSGLTGLLGAVGRRSIPTIARKLVTDNQRTVAPFLADILTKANLPTTRPIPPGFLEKFVTNGDQKLAKTLNLIWMGHIQKNNPQTNPAQ
jgi:hypothetical protein